ncbi:MAG: neutral zinc metallopeptidase [Vicinamibacterales bacterium]
MRWTAGRDRDNIEDRRGHRGGRFGGGAAPVGIGGLLLLLILSWATGTNFLQLLDTGDGAMVESSAPIDSSPGEEQLIDFVNAVSGDTQDVWTQLLGSRYQRAKVVIFRDVTSTACGQGAAATGPFYCPADRQVYLDLGFFDELDRRFGAPGDFAQAYVIAHEYGHHVQTLLGYDQRVGNDRAGANSAAVALELQADCFAGVWGHAASQGGRFERGQVELDPGDTDEALRAAAAIGDDRLQRMAQGRVQPERFTHGTSAQRVEWFRRGFDTGDPRQCDAFAATQR